MKFCKTLFTIALFGLLINFQAKAQNNRYQLYQVHEDRVLEGMMDKHSKGDKAIVEAAREQKMKGMNWITFVADNNRVMYLSPIDNMADLDKNPFEDLQQKMGKEAFDKLFDNFDDTYSKHGDYILRLDNELSYMPEGMTTTPEGENYRELTFYHIPPGKAEKAEELARSVKKMYSEKNSKVHYRLYKSGFGNMGYYYMVVVAAKDPEDMERKREENMNLLGDEIKTIADKIDSDFPDQEVVTGYIKPELSYVEN